MPLIDNAEAPQTMDAGRREIKNLAMVVRDSLVEAIGAGKNPRRDIAGDGREPERIAFRIDDIQPAGAGPVAALLTCAPARSRQSPENGETVIENGSIRGLDADVPVHQRNQQPRRRLKQAACRGNDHE